MGRGGEGELEKVTKVGGGGRRENKEERYAKRDTAGGGRSGEMERKMEKNSYQGD